MSEFPTFTSQQASTGSYQATLTVGTSDFGIVGYDSTGFGGFVDPYGSISLTTFELAGVEYSLTGLYPDSDALQLLFDRPLPEGVEFTLTLGTAEFDSGDVSSTGRAYFRWASGAPSWSDGQQVAVELDFTTAVPFREGTTREGAFSTPPLPATLAFEAEMTVGVSTAQLFAGYTSLVGSLSETTFKVGGVDYTVRQAGFTTAAPTSWLFQVDPALPFDSFTLTLGSTELLSSDASVSVGSDGVGQYTWSGTNPNWTDGQEVDVKLDIGLIDICDRSSAVAHAIKAATPSFDFCHMTSLLDLDDLTELDLPGGEGTGLKAGDFEGLSGLTRLDLSHYILSLQQLPVGVFDGLDSLTHLDLSHTDLLKLDRGVFDGLDNLVELDLSDTRLQRGTVPVGVFYDVPNLEVLRLSNESPIGGYRRSFSNLNDDFFRGLGNLRELDVRASNPLRDSPRSLLPLTSLTTLNGRPYTRLADPPANFQYASGRIDHELGYHRTCYAVMLKWDRSHQG